MKSNVADTENPKNMPKLPPTDPMKSCRVSTFQKIIVRSKGYRDGKNGIQLRFENKNVILLRSEVQTSLF